MSKYDCRWSGKKPSSRALYGNQHLVSDRFVWEVSKGRLTTSSTAENQTSPKARLFAAVDYWDPQTHFASLDQAWWVNGSGCESDN